MSINFLGGFRLVNPWVPELLEECSPSLFRPTRKSKPSIKIRNFYSLSVLPKKNVMVSSLHR